MPRVRTKIVVCLSLPCVAGACAGHGGPRPTAELQPRPRADMAGRTMAVSADTFEVAYRGAGEAIRAPLKDLNFAHERIPAALKRAATAPYSTEGVDSCAALTEEIAALDLALGPDLDTPDLEKTGDIYSRGASLAADAALDAMRSAAVGYLPMRSVIRQISGAEKLEKRTRKAVLAGSVRRGFLKAIGMERGCGWPAAPLNAKAVPLDAAAPIVIAKADPAPARPAATPAVTLVAVSTTVSAPALPATTPVALVMAEPPPLTVPAIASSLSPAMPVTVALHAVGTR